MNLFQNKLMRCSHALQEEKRRKKKNEKEKPNKGPILFIFRFDLGISQSAPALPTHIA